MAVTQQTGVVSFFYADRSSHVDRLVQSPSSRRAVMTSRRQFMSASIAPLLQAAETNEKIRSAREAAVAVLKPRQKDLEHALELHAASLVVESYGFAPRSAIDGDKMRAAIEGGANSLEVEDLYTEMQLMRVADDPSQLPEYRDAWKASGVTCVLQNAG
jgi:hypothetical protein